MVPGFSIVVSDCCTPLIINLAMSKEPEVAEPDTHKLITSPAFNEDLSVDARVFQSASKVVTLLQLAVVVGGAVGGVVGLVTGGVVLLSHCLGLREH